MKVDVHIMRPLRNQVADERSCIGLMKGAGWGFTPSGDDFLCGMLAGLNAAGALYGRDVRPLIRLAGRAVVRACRRHAGCGCR